MQAACSTGEDTLDVMDSLLRDHIKQKALKSYGKDITKKLLAKVKRLNLDVKPAVEQIVQKLNFTVDYDNCYPEQYYLHGDRYNNFKLCIRFLNHITGYLVPRTNVLLMAPSVTRFMLTCICAALEESGRVYLLGFWPPNDEKTKSLSCYDQLVFQEKNDIPANVKFHFIWDDAETYDFYQEWLVDNGAFFQHDFCSKKHTINIKQGAGGSQPIVYNDAC